MATELRATESAIELRLADLHARGLVSKEGNSFCYDAGDSGAVVNELADVYRTRRTTVIEAIFSGPSEAVRSFADAFLLGPDEQEEAEGEEEGG